jgi:predicted ABC-type ATPase
MAEKPRVLLIGGPNGAGKTTFASRLLPLLGISHFVNADEIARGLNPQDPESVSVEAGREMLQQIKHFRGSRTSFAFESTLASRSFARTLRACSEDGFETILVYVWVSSPSVSVERVAHRVASGGHNVPRNDVIRRWHRSARNLFELYLPVADEWRVWLNRDTEGYLPVAAGTLEKVTSVWDAETWSALQQVGSNDAQS